MEYLNNIKQLADSPKHVMISCAVIFAAWVGMVVYIHVKPEPEPSCTGYVECAVDKVQEVVGWKQF